MLEELVALASTAGTALVAAMATDAWQAARAGAARLFGRIGSTHEIEAQLDRHERTVARAEDPDQVRERLAAIWKAEMELVLDQDPAAAEEMQALLTRIQDMLPSAQRAWIVQNITVSGTGNLTNIVAGGNIIHHDVPAGGPDAGSRG